MQRPIHIKYCINLYQLFISNYHHHLLSCSIGRPLSKEVKETVIRFYNDDRVSVNMPGMKDYVSTRDEDGKKIHIQND